MMDQRNGKCRACKTSSRGRGELLGAFMRVTGLKKETALATRT